MAEPGARAILDDTTQRTSEILAALADLCLAHEISLGELMARVDEHSHAVIGLIFGAVFLLPIPLPGFSVVLGAVLILVGIRMAEGKGPWVPARWAAHRMPGRIFTLTLRAAARVARFFEPLTRPRLGVFHESRRARRVNGALIAVCGLLLSLPMPPGFNLPPALAIIALSVGTMERDGLVILVGYAAAFLNIILFSVIAVAGVSGLQVIYILVARLFDFG